VESIDSDFSPIVEDGLLVAPIRVYYEVTKRCNLRCKHCFNISGIETKSELSASEVINILHGLKQNGVIDIRFT
jgi:MoaA/NifB/PqqE/SkfB family radical SAM enzyme